MGKSSSPFKMDSQEASFNMQKASECDAKKLLFFLKTKKPEGGLRFNSRDN